MHLLGKSFEAFVSTLDGRTIPLITIPNPNNPFSPPREVIGTNGSMRVTDEMFQLIMTYVPYHPGDENISLER